MERYQGFELGFLEKTSENVIRKWYGAATNISLLYDGGRLHVLLNKAKVR